MSTPWPQLLESLRRAPVVRVGAYDYFLHPLTDGIASVTAGLLREAAEGLSSILPPGVGRVLTAEAMGIPAASALALSGGPPYLVARKRSYGLPGEIVVPYKTGYAAGTLHVNDLRPGERIAVVDDVLSGGGTVRALAEAVRRAGAQLVGVAVLVNKGVDLTRFSQELGAPVRALFELRIVDGSVHVSLSHAPARLPA